MLLLLVRLKRQDYMEFSHKTPNNESGQSQTPFSKHVAFPWHSTPSSKQVSSFSQREPSKWSEHSQCPVVILQSPLRQWLQKSSQTEQTRVESKVSLSSGLYKNSSLFAVAGYQSKFQASPNRKACRYLEERSCSKV